MLELGPHEGTIQSHRSRILGGKEAISILCAVGDEQAEAIIFLTEKSLGMARAALKLCGFDIDKQDLLHLDMSPTLLAGRKVPLMVGEYNGKTQVKIDINQRIDKATLGNLTKQLRSVKKAAQPAPDDDIPF